MGVVFVLGAGASHGESLTPIDETPARPCCVNARTPLQSEFFSDQLYESFHTRTSEYSRQMAESDYPSLFRYVRDGWPRNANEVDLCFDALSIEDVFTSIEIDREFHGPDTAEGARLLVARNDLIRYIQRILGLCTDNKRGEFSGRLVAALGPADSILSFNWDLITDQAFADSPRGGMVYTNFGILTGCTFRGYEPRNPDLATEVAGFQCGPGPTPPLFLKLHGSLNWFRCTQAGCPSNRTIELNGNIQGCLYHAEGIGERHCDRCGSKMMPLLIPPVLNKQIASDPIIRSSWGLARRALEAAEKVVIIGLSFAPTDFYAQWLFRSTVGRRLAPDDVIVVNPELGECPCSSGLRHRLNGIFAGGYNPDFRHFSEIGGILERVGRGPNSETPRRSET